MNYYGEEGSAAHLCLFPKKYRSQLFIEGVDKLKTWLEKQEKTNTGISYWLPVYMKLRGMRQFHDLYMISFHMTVLAISQEKREKLNGRELI